MQVSRVLICLQATIDANDGDFVIPTLRPVSRGSSRHSILVVASHDAQHSKTAGHPDQSTRRSSSRKTSFNLGQESVDPASAAQWSTHDVPTQSPLSPRQQQQSRRSSAGESVTEPGQGHVSDQQQKQAALPDQTGSAQSDSQDTEAQDEAPKQAGLGRRLGHTRSAGAVGRILPSKPSQTRDKSVRPIQDWVGLGSKKQLHK